MCLSTLLLFLPFGLSCRCTGKSASYLLHLDKLLSDATMECSQSPAGVILCSKCAVVLITLKCFMALRVAKISFKSEPSMKQQSKKVH